MVARLSWSLAYQVRYTVITLNRTFSVDPRCHRGQWNSHSMRGSYMGLAVDMLPSSGAFWLALVTRKLVQLSRSV